MAYYSWKAISSYVRVSMETIPVTFDTFFATHLEETASLKSTAKMVRDFSTRQRLRSRPIMAFVIGTMLFILAWPTIAGAMTGYTSAESAFVSDSGGSLIPLDNYYLVPYVIHDGWRIGLEGNHLVTHSCEFYITAYVLSGWGAMLTFG
jgi:hypothetical protein